MTRYGGRESSRLARALDTPAATKTGDHAVDELVSLTQQLSRIRLDDRPDPAFRAETLQRVIALAEQRAATLERPAKHRRVTSWQLRAPAWGRRVAVAVAVLSVLFATTGLLTLASRQALPGDALYAVKRGAENVQLGLTRDRTERGFAHLHIAEARLDEVTELVAEPVALTAGVPGMPLAAGADTAESVVSTLADMDRQTAAGISLLTAAAVDRSDTATLEILPTWAQGQQNLLGALFDQMSQPAQDRAQASLALLVRVDERARMLGLALPCECLEDFGPADDLGPMPCESCSTVGPGQPGGTPTTPTTPGAPTEGTPSQPVPSATRISPTS